MFSFFRKKPELHASAVLVDNGRDVVAEGLRSPKYNSYSGPEPLFAMKVRVTDDAGQSWDATMKAGPATSFLLLPGVRVKVRYREGKRDKVTIDDTPMAILEKNPQMKKDS